MGKLINSLYDLVIDGSEDIPQFVEPSEDMKQIDCKLGRFDHETRDFMAYIKSSWQVHGFANGFACALHLLGECGSNADKLTAQAGKFFKSKQETPAEAAQGAEDKQGQEDKPQTSPAEADGADGQCFDYATSVHFLLKNVEVATDRANLLAGDMKSLHIDHEAHTRFDMLQGELCKIGQYIADFRHTYESGEQTATPCTCGGCDNCKDNEAAGGVQA